MANLKRLPNTLEYQDVRTNIRAHLIATGVDSGSSQTGSSCFLYVYHLWLQPSKSHLSTPDGSRRNRSPPGDDHQDHRNQEVHHNDRDRDAHQRHLACEHNRSYNQEVN